MKRSGCFEWVTWILLTETLLVGCQRRGLEKNSTQPSEADRASLCEGLGDLTLTSMIGEKKKISSLLTTSRVIISFWASWCPPCIEEMPGLLTLSKQLRSGVSGQLNSVRVLLVSVDEDVEAAKAMIRTRGWSLSGGDDYWFDASGASARTCGSAKFPETYLYEAGKGVTFKWVGPQDWFSKEILGIIFKTSMIDK